MKFTDYLKYKRNTIAAFLFFAVILTLCLFLYNIPLAVLWYPYALCGTAGIVFLIMGYISCRRTCRNLDQILLMTSELTESLDNMPELLPGSLSPEAAHYQRIFPEAAHCHRISPEATWHQRISPEAARYRQIIRALCNENIKKQADFTRKYYDLLDYYTAWVHQIKTPITAMKLSFQNEDSALSRQSLNDLRRIEQYVDMVITYLKLESGDIDYVIREHKLDDIIRPVIRSFAGEFINRKLRLEYEQVDYFVLTDDKWFAFVLEQIISNALKYTRKGSIRICMEGSELLVTDTGIGIEPADIPRVFEKGFTGCNGRMDRRASGIGLYLCKRICDNLSLPIRVESIIGTGTTVGIDLAQKAIGIE